MTQIKPFIKQYGRFQVQEKIGAGGFGTVYRGYDPMWEKLVAVKVLNHDLARLPEAVDRFRKEARTASALRHPHIVGVMEVGEQDGDYYLVMDYIPGETLSKLIQREKTFSIGRVVALLSPVAEALDYVHSRKLIHRDVKPSNILLGEDGQPFLSDFGLIKLKDDVSNTTTGVVLGTVEYMAPEQVLGKELTSAVDQYSLGIIAYQMLTGTAPFTGNSPFEIQEGHVHHPLPDPRKIRPEIPAEVCTVLSRALAKDPAERYTAAAAFIHDLECAAQLTYQASSQKWITQAREKAAAYDYDEAILLLEKAIFILPSAELEQEIADYRSRSKTYAEFIALSHQVEIAQIQFSNISSQFPWLPQPMAEVLDLDASSASTLDEPFKAVWKTSSWVAWVEWAAIAAVILSFFAVNAAAEYPGHFWYPAGMLVLVLSFGFVSLKPDWRLAVPLLAVGAVMAASGWFSFLQLYMDKFTEPWGADYQFLLFLAVIGITIERVLRRTK